MDYASAAIVRGSDEGARAGRVCGSNHRRGNFFRSAKRDGADGGTGTAEESAKRTDGFSGADHVVEKWNKLFSEGLVKIVREGASKRRVFAGRERGGDRTGVTRIFDGLQPIDSGRKKSAGFRSRDLEIGNKKDEVHLRADG